MGLRQGIRESMKSRPPGQLADTIDGNGFVPTLLEDTVLSCFQSCSSALPFIRNAFFLIIRSSCALLLLIVPISSSERTLYNVLSVHCDFK